MEKITALIPCFNEEDCLAQALESVRWADEILVVDSFSTDASLEIAKKFGARIIQRAYEYSASQKNWAIPQATHPWILLLDADEVLEAQAEIEIRTLLNTQPKEVAFWLYRQNFYMDQKVSWGMWRGDKVIRLFMRDTCLYQDKRVHAEIIANGSVGFLKTKINHYTYKNLGHLLSKVEKYSTWKAKDKFEKGASSSFFLMVAKPFFVFIKSYFLKLGILDGRPGFIIAAISSWSVFLRQLKIWRMTKGEKF